ncbi:MAG: hypothetical protein Q8T09_06460 [Candidatus Melainabacteria bacterium]|nr:hypothetical protein [Candidatus Melainabacteria bacterium]
MYKVEKNTPATRHDASKPVQEPIAGARNKIKDSITSLTSIARMPITTLKDV